MENLEYNESLTAGENWVEFALSMGHGILNTGNHQGIMYGTMSPENVPPFWILINPSGDKELDRNTLREALTFQRKVFKEQG